MKLSALACVFLMGVACVGAEPLKQGERDRALSALHGGRKQFIDVVSGVNAAQWNFKPAPGVWSIAEIAEHLTLSERDIPNIIQKFLDSPSDPAKLAQTKGKDQDVLTKVASREQKAQAPETLRPRKTFASRDALLKAFKEYRDKNITFIRETQIDLRSKVGDHPGLGPLDCYQWYLMMAAHTERHVAQMREVMANPNFPK
jgi:hypothetical protein